MLLIAALLFSGGASAQEKLKPVISGPWRVLFAPKISGDYVNDHTVFQDAEGKWRAVGITSPGQSLSGYDERYFAHGVADSLDREMTEQPPLFKGWPDGRKKWAPHVVRDGSAYHLFAGPHAVRHFTSADGITWKYEGLAIPDPWGNFRDTMVLKLDPGKWLLYATDQDDTVSVFESADLFAWQRVGTAFRAIRPAPIWGFLAISATESPFVVKRGDYYYLSVTLTNYAPKNYTNTIVVRSRDPYDFGVYAAGGKGETAEFVATLPAHCAEYIRDDRGEWFITSGGWKGWPVPAGATPGALSIAPLRWEPAE